VGTLFSRFNVNLRATGSADSLPALDEFFVRHSSPSCCETNLLRHVLNHVTASTKCFVRIWIFDPHAFAEDVILELQSPLDATFSSITATA